MSVARSSLSLPSLSSNPKPQSVYAIPSLFLPHSRKHLRQIRCSRRWQRMGKLRFPSEKKKLREINKQKIDVNEKFQGIWRLSKLGVEVNRDPGKDFLGISDALLEQIAKALQFPVASMLPAEAFSVVRKSFDARKVLKEPKFVYSVDMDPKKLLELEPRVQDFISKLEPRVGLVEHIPQTDNSGDLMSITDDCKKKEEGVAVEAEGHLSRSSGSSVQFATLVLAEVGADVTLIEGGQPVVQREPSLNDHGLIECMPDIIDDKFVAGSNSKGARVSNARNGNAQRVVSSVSCSQLHDEFGVSSSSSIGQCNVIMKQLERSGDFKALDLFAWMKRNGKLRGNVTAYNLALRVLGRRGDWEGAETLIQEMKLESGCELGYQVFNTIIYACSKRGLVAVGARWFRLMMEYGIEPNVATFGMIMALYQKDWNVKEAEYAFSMMRELRIKCQSAYSSMITIYTRLGLFAKAEEVIVMLTEDEVTLNAENWLVMLNAYSQQGKLDKAESVLGSMKRDGFTPNIVAYNTLMTGYGKISDMDSAERLFRSLKSNALEYDETTFRSMIEGWARVGNYEKAKWYYLNLKSSGFKPNSSNLYSLLKLQANNEDERSAVETLGDMLKIGCQPSSVLGTLLQVYEQAGRFDKLPLVIRSTLYEHVRVNPTACSILVMAYVKHGLVDNAIRVLKEKQWNDPVFEDNLYHLLICSCKELGCHENAVEIFTQMPKSDDKPNLHIVSTMIDIYSVMNQFDNAESLYQMLKSSGVMMDMVSFSVVVRMYVKAGKLRDACSVLDIMQKQNIVPDVYLVRDMLRIYQQCEEFEKLSDVYYRILKSEITWDQEMYNCVINCCARALPVDELSKIFDEMLNKGFSPNTITCNVMLDVYGKSRLFRKARKVFWIAKKRGLTDVISYNTLIAAYGQSKHLRKMNSTVEQMQFEGFSVSLEAYNCMLDSYGKERQMDRFKDVLQKMKDSNCQSDNYTYNILINIYGEQGWIEEVRTILKELKENGPGPDLCRYNTLIKAYGIAGMVEEAVSLIKEMRGNGINPDRTTYQNLVNALQRNDQFLEAVKWSLWMKQTGFSRT